VFTGLTWKERKWEERKYIFLDVTPCSLVERHYRFDGTCWVSSQANIFCNLHGVTSLVTSDITRYSYLPLVSLFPAGDNTSKLSETSRMERHSSACTRPWADGLGMSAVRVRHVSAGLRVISSLFIYFIPRVSFTSCGFSWQYWLAVGL
jgi:hypothetical protein